jgi:hypothetical protein
MLEIADRKDSVAVKADVNSDEVAIRTLSAARELAPKSRIAA